MPESTTLGNGIQMLGAGAGFLVIALAVGELGRFEPHRVTPTALAGLAWLVVLGSLVAFSLYLWLIRVAPMPLVATQAYVSPVVAVALGAYFRHEVLTVRELVAGTIIIAGVVLVASAPLLTSGRAKEELAAA
jgi:drug/metabolite transporter (DMT)-like permease